jgi:hypothetical protein
MFHSTRWIHNQNKCELPKSMPSGSTVSGKGRANRGLFGEPTLCLAEAEDTLMISVLPYGLS